METRLSNILKTTKATKIIKTILESTYKAVLGTYKLGRGGAGGATQPVILLREVEI